MTWGLAPGRKRAPAPRAKRLTEQGRLALALLEREAEERAALAGATAARHAARDEVTRG